MGLFCLNAAVILARVFLTMLGLVVVSIGGFCLFKLGAADLAAAPEVLLIMAGASGVKLDVSRLAS